MMTFEFGEPRLLVREPLASKSESIDIRRRLARRRVKPIGAWTLWVYCCHWRAVSHEQDIAHDEADDAAIRAASQEFDGQKLTAVVLDARNRKATFHFDLGGVLFTWPYETGNDEQWLLRMPDQRGLAYRADGRYSVGPTGRKPEEETWEPLPDSLGLLRIGAL